MVFVKCCISLFCELYLLKDRDLTISLYQRVLGIGTVSAIVDSKDSSEKAGKRVYIKNIKNLFDFSKYK